MLRVSTFIIVMFTLLFIRDTIYKTEQYYDERRCSLGDYSLILSKLPNVDGIQSSIRRFFNEGLNVSQINIFYKRRWYRTLPLYYFAFLVNIFLLKFSHPSINIFSAFYMKYLFFIQNFDFKHYEFFSVSWSLAIEEWFYLLLPLFLVIINKKQNFLKKLSARKDNLYIDLIKLIVFITLIRFWYVLLYNPGVDVGLRTFIPVRFDALLIGVLFACFKINNRQIFDKFLNKKVIIINFTLLTIVTLWLSCTLLMSTYSLNILFLKIFSWSILSFSFINLIIFFEHNTFINNKLSNFSLVKNFFERTSIYSYSIYLFHGFILDFYSKYMHLFNNSQKTFLLLPLSIITIYLVSAFLYRYIEKPIMDLREKF